MGRCWCVVGAVAGLSVLAACGDDPPTDAPPEPNCTETGLPEDLFMPSETVSPIRGNISIKDRRDYSLDDLGMPKANNLGIIQATFARVSTGTPTMEALMPLGMNCLGRLSRSQVNAPRFLAMDGVMIKSTGRGDVATTSVNPGRYSSTGALVLSGASAPRAVGTQSAGGEFPSFDEAISTVEPLELTAPASDGLAILEVDDLLIRWTGTGGQGALITIIPEYEGPVQSGGQVVCQVLDDGCFTLPAAATNFLLANRDQSPSGQPIAVAKFTLVVERYIISFVEPAAQTVLTLDSSTEYRLTLRNGVE
jgi:hypothetical protein